MRAKAPVAAGLVGLAALLWLDGWLGSAPGSRSVEPSGKPPPEMARALDGAVRALAGGGIAVNRRTLFSAARQALEKAPPASWLALTDPAGTVQAWWGEAPASVAVPAGAGPVAVDWSATTLTVISQRTVGSGAFSGVVACARSFPVSAPEFARALGLSGGAAGWEPVAAPAFSLLPAADGAVLVGARFRASQAAERSGNALALAVILGAAAVLIGRANRGYRVGPALALAFLGSAAAAAPGHRALADPVLLCLAAGLAFLPTAARFLRRDTPPAAPAAWRAAGFVLLGMAFFASSRIEVPDLGSAPGDAMPSVARLAALAALVGASLVVAAVGRGVRQAARGWITASFLLSLVFLAAALTFVGTGPWYVAALG